MPIVGLLMDDVWHNGRLIVPAGTEIHGAAEGASGSPAAINSSCRAVDRC